MSRTYLNMMDKAALLVDGLKKNYDEIKNYGISLDELSEVEVAVKDGRILNAEVERLREQTNEVATEANKKLATVKDKTTEMKRIVKRNIDMSRWPDFGVMDKR